VDKVKWTTSTIKFKAILSLKRRGYKPKPLKRMYIEKSNGKSCFDHISHQWLIDNVQIDKERGLTLSEEKTLITNISTGFEFLGFNIRKYNGKLLIKPSEKGQKKITKKLHEAIFSNKSVSQCRLIEILNPVITRWGNYFRHAVAKKVFAKIDHILVD
jgi:retron-type reverse transcriptase